eukprot:g3257.t1
MASELPDKISSLHLLLSKLAPNVAPVIVPKQFSKLIKSPLNWCMNDEQSDRIAAVMSEEMKKGGVEMERELVFLTTIDMKSMTWRINEARWVHPSEEMFYSLEDFLQYSCLTDDTRKDVRLRATQFLERNGQNSNNTILLGQCYSSAYALKVLLGNVARLKACFGSSVSSAIALPLAEDVDIDAVEKEFKKLFNVKKGEKEVVINTTERKKKKKKKRKKSASSMAASDGDIKRPRRKQRAASYEENIGS